MIEARCHKRSQSASPAHVLCTHLPSGILESLQASSDVSENALAALSVCSIALSGRWVGWEGVGGGGHVKCSKRKNIFTPSSMYGMRRSVRCGLPVDMLALNLSQMLLVRGNEGN